MHIWKIALLNYKNQIESSAALSHVEIYNKCAQDQSTHSGADVVFRGIPARRVAWFGKSHLAEPAGWCRIHCTRRNTSNPVTTHLTKPSSRASWLSWQRELGNRSSCDSRKNPFSPLLPTWSLTRECSSLANDFVGFTRSFHTVVSHRSAVVLLGKVEEIYASSVAEGMGQAISYSSRMLEANEPRWYSNGRSVAFFCTALEINIIKVCKWR